MDYGNTKTSMYSRLGSATLSQLAFSGERNPNFPWEKSHWDNTAVKSNNKKKVVLRFPLPWVFKTSKLNFFGDISALCQSIVWTWSARFKNRVRLERSRKDLVCSFCSVTPWQPWRWPVAAVCQSKDEWSTLQGSNATVSSKDVWRTAHLSRGRVCNEFFGGSQSEFTL